MHNLKLRNIEALAGGDTVRTIFSGVILDGSKSSELVSRGDGAFFSNHVRPKNHRLSHLIPFLLCYLQLFLNQILTRMVRPLKQNPLLFFLLTLLLLHRGLRLDIATGPRSPELALLAVG